ncbi:MAG: TonB-dependent receptor plug domain-containing protein [Gammaproteobacteria bacterium]
MTRLLLLLACVAAASAAEAAPFAGQSLQQALEQLRAQGLPLFYSSDLVTPDMRVEREPVATDLRAILEEILAPHGLATAPARGGGLLLVRAESREAARAAAIRPVTTPLSEVIVSASHYQFGDEIPSEPTVFTAADLEQLPDMGDDPVRAVSRLPGVARADFSSRTHLRGGSSSETLVLFDDLRLYNPYHFKDFFGLFSTIDPGIVGDVSVYTGGFPVNYGDRSSGVIAFRPEPPEDEFYGRALLSLFSAGASAGGTFDGGNGEWLASARRGNMDLIFSLTADEIGEPDYYDLHARVSRRFGEKFSLSANYLAFDDKLVAFDSDQEESAQATYRDEYFWLRLDAGDSEGSGGRVLASRTRLSSARSGTAGLPGIASGTLLDQRRFTIDAVQADGWWRPRDGVMLQTGAEWRGQSGRYLYQDQAQFELLFDTPGAPTETSRTRDIALTREGDQLGAYVNLRLELSPRLTTDLGLRWDRETLSAGEESDLSPRAVLLWQPRERTRLRLSWGRFAQAQGIDELPVSDGQTTFAPPQHSTHLVASLEQNLTAALELRLEAYRKDYDDLQPRYENLLNTLVVLPELKPDRIAIAPDSARATGFEASLFWNARPWTGWLSYTLSQVEDRVAGTDIARSWDQRHYLSAGLGYRGERWECTVAATWHSGWPTTDVELETLDPEAIVAIGPRNARQIGDYFRIDARAARRFEFEGGSELSVFFEVTNLLGRPNDCCLEYQLEDEEIPGEVFLDVATVNSLPLVPSIGVLWRF